MSAAIADRRRVFSMAVTSTDGRDRGRPSSWSSAIDRLACDYDDTGIAARFFVLSAGNTRDDRAWTAYPQSLATNSIHDPAQAWNALTIGAYTQLNSITERDALHYGAIAPVDGLSPFTTTSVTWQNEWPIKPDVVFEGGNAAVEPGGFASTFSSLSLLTTHYQPTQKLFDTANGTSAASALASKMATEVWAYYPDFWPETVRGLLVHSARWTPQMLDEYLQGLKDKKSVRSLLRHCGYGVPTLERALWSASNSLTDHDCARRAGSLSKAAWRSGEDTRHAFARSSVANGNTRVARRCTRDDARDAVLLHRAQPW